MTFRLQCGKQYAAAGPDYCYGINVVLLMIIIASLLYVKFLTEQSNFAFSEGGIPVVKCKYLMYMLHLKE